MISERHDLTVDFDWSNNFWMNVKLGVTIMLRKSILGNDHHEVGTTKDKFSLLCGDLTGYTYMTE